MSNRNNATKTTAGFITHIPNKYTHIIHNQKHTKKQNCYFTIFISIFLLFELISLFCSWCIRMDFLLLIKPFLYFSTYTSTNITLHVLVYVCILQCISLFVFWMPTKSAFDLCMIVSFNDALYHMFVSRIYVTVQVINVVNLSLFYVKLSSSFFLFFPPTISWLGSPYFSIFFSSPTLDNFYSVA